MENGGGAGPSCQSGKKLPLTREDVLQQIGELLYFRGKLNLHSEVRHRAPHPSRGVSAWA